MSKKIYKNLDWRKPRVVAGFPGKDAKRLYNTIKEDEKFYGDNSNLGFIAYSSGEIVGSTSLRAGQVYNLVKDSGIRVSVPRDNIKGDIFDLIKGKYFSNFNALVTHKDKPSYYYERNKGLWKKVIELAEEKKGNVKYPFMIQGFYIVPDKTEKGYGVKIIPASNFEIIENKIFSEKYSGMKFDKYDSDGIPMDLNKSKGNFAFHIGSKGLSEVYLDTSGDFNAKYGDLNRSLDMDNSVVDGRLIFIKDLDIAKK